MILQNEFVPSSSDIYTVLSVESPYTLSGDFANVADGGYLFFDSGHGRFTVNYDDAVVPNEIVLSDFQSVPEPALALPAGHRGLRPAAGSPVQNLPDSVKKPTDSVPLAFLRWLSSVGFRYRSRGVPAQGQQRRASLTFPPDWRVPIESPYPRRD